MAKTRSRTTSPALCECSDPGCPVCHGSCMNKGTDQLHRVDMEDKTGTLMCEGCAADAHEAGVFRDATIAEKIDHRRK